MSTRSDDVPSGRSMGRTLNDVSTILLTGGTGSFGAAFVKRHQANHTIRVFSRGELAQSRMQVEFPGCKYFIGDVRDRDRLKRAAKGVDLIVHAAALKQVEACNYNPSEAVATNVMGTQNVLDAAGSTRVIVVSTDKAVQPQTTYGYTKALAENVARIHEATIVRYGNVLKSRGWVGEAFSSQASSLGYLKITDPQSTRFWMTQDQVQDLVQEAMDGREGLLVPRVPSGFVVDLALALHPRTPQRIVGLRAGEKIHEILETVEEAEDGIEYRSDTNPHRIGVDELRRLVGAPPPLDPPRDEHALQGEVA